ncbi:MAG: ROK family protein [Ignavibacteria bacterium]|nr:ROK family protein [Ignavibacteria bacterium]
MIKNEIALGIDIGGTNTAFGLVNSEGKCLFKKSVSTKSDEPAENLFYRIFEVINSKMDSEESLSGIGIGAPNANYYKGTIENPPNLKWEFVNVAETVSNFSSAPVFVTNDANAAALGEMKFGAARNMKNFIEITLGTGLGSGIIVNGELVYGHDGFAGEMGHTIIERNGRECGCGRKGCLETYVSATGIVRTYFYLLSKTMNKSSLKAKPRSEITAKDIYEAALKDDPVALESFDITAKYLGMACADAVGYFSPEAFILFGGLAGAGDLLTVPAKRYMEENIMNIFKGKVEIILSELNSGDAAILGAAALVFHNAGNKTTEAAVNI